MVLGTVDHVLALAVEYHQTGRLAEAKVIYRQILLTKPKHARALQLLAVAEHQCGQHKAAVGLLKRSIQIDQQQADAHFNLGCVLSALGRDDQAITAYRRSLKIEPRQFAAHINLGNTLRKRGSHEDALSHYLKACRVAPYEAEPQFLAGATLDGLARVDRAIEHYERAVEIDPSHAEAHNNLGVALHTRDTDRAIEHYRLALAVNSEHANAWQNLAKALALRGVQCLEDGQYVQAIADYDASLAAQPNNGLEVRKALALPTINTSIEQIHQQRTAIRDHIDAIKAKGLCIKDPVREIDTTTFLLTYHGMNDRSILESLSQFYRQACPALHYTVQSPPHRDRLRVGFVSRNLYRHTISCFMEGWIRDLDRTRFEVVVARLPQPDDEVSQRIDTAADYRVDLTNDLSESRRMLAEQQFDVLIYPDIGMEPMTYFLAFARLAPVQCVWWGHPSTTGIDTVDYYLSCDDLETETAQTHYSEELIRFPTLAMYSPKPQLPDYAKTRIDFGFNERGHLYLCPQSLFKLQPEFDMRLGKILRADSEGQVVLFEGRKKGWTNLLRKRLRRAIPDVVDRIIFLERQPFSAYLGLVATADVLLDPLHFGGGNTTYQALALGTPVVTQPGSLARGRMTLACYRQMNMEELVAKDEESYVNLSVRLATDLVYQDAIRTKIAQCHHVLFSNRSSVSQLGSFLERAVQERAMKTTGTHLRTAI